MMQQERPTQTMRVLVLPMPVLQKLGAAVFIDVGAFW